MESLGGSASSQVGFSVRRKRTSMCRRPRSNLHCFTFLPPSTQPTYNEENDSDKVGCSNGYGSENKLKLKLKLGGVTHTIHTKPTSDIIGDGSAHHSHASKQRQKLVWQDDKWCSLPPNKGKGNGVQWKDATRTISLGKGHLVKGKSSLDSMTVNGTFISEPARKSKRVRKRHVLDEVLTGDDSDDEDEEIRYLERLKSKRTTQYYEVEEDEGNKSRHGIHGDRDYLEEEEPILDDDPGSKRKKQRKGSVDPLAEALHDSTPTTRNRALLSGKAGLSLSGSSNLEFPNGLPPAPSKKQKEKLSELEQQLKKAEAAQRRRMQAEKAARDAEAEAIRKILGQDSGRKKREEKMKKHREELAQGRDAKSDALTSSTIRWVFGPNGTTITFSEDIGLPDIFRSAPCSYPLPREKCVGPNCTNAYKYRDSKSKLPLCSLQCYKAIQGKVQHLIAC